MEVVISSGRCVGVYGFNVTVVNTVLVVDDFRTGVIALVVQEAADRIVSLGDVIGVDTVTMFSGSLPGAVK